MTWLQFLGLYYLPPITVTFILNLTPIFVLTLSILFLNEKPSPLQLIGITLTLCGVYIFFFNSIQVIEQTLGIVITLVSGLGWSIYMIILRYYFRENAENVYILTFCSMISGAFLLLATAALTGNLIKVSNNSLIVILWLSLVNTSLAFILWNDASKSLKAYEQSTLQNTMLIQIALLTYIFLNKQLVLQEILGMVMVFIGVLIVQLKSN